MNMDWPLDPTFRRGEEYVKYANVYDLLSDHLEDDVSFYLRIAGSCLPAGGTILELGTGTGRLTKRLLGAGYRVVGIEPCGEMLQRAEGRLARFNGALRLIQSDAQSMEPGRRFRLAVATYGMVAHLLTDEERLAVFRNVYRHLEADGVFIFDDMPGWLAGASDGSRLDIERTVVDPESGMVVRLMSNMIDVADQPLSVRYDFIDWLDAGGKVVKRVVVRVLFRNISLEEELRLLRQAGFGDIKLIGGFDDRPFMRDDAAANTRLILRCRRLDD